MSARSRWKLDDKGLSLAELLVAMMLSLLLITMSATFFIQTARITTATTKAESSTSEAINVANATTESIRLATQLPTGSGMIPAIYTAQPDHLVFFAYIDTDPLVATPPPTRASIRLLSDGRVVLTTCSMTRSGATYNPTTCNGERRRTLDTEVTNPGGFFTFNDLNGDAIALVSGAVPATGLRNIASVTIDAVVRERGSDAEPVHIRNTVQMPNIGIR